VSVFARSVGGLSEPLQQGLGKLLGVAPGQRRNSAISTSS
jgi:hypothetical protein